MSVIVKGMKMPENCEKCPIREGTFCDIINKDIDRFYSGAVKRDPDCPLVELPEKHGRLIDADALKEEFPKDTDWEYPVNTNEYVCEMINNAKTVIEAEDG